MTTCARPETSWFRDQQLSPPLGHSCEYVKARNALIPAATRAANEKSDPDDPLAWTKAFMRAMNRLAKEHEL